MGMMDVTHLKSRPLTSQSPGTQSTQTPFMGKFSQRIGLIHKLRQLGTAEKFFYGSSDGPDIYQYLRRKGFHVMDTHPFPYHPFHSDQTGAELILQKFANGTQPSISQVINNIGSALAVYKF